MLTCSGRQGPGSSGTFNACREKSFSPARGDAKKKREGLREGEMVGGEGFRAVTLSRTPDASFYFPSHVLFRSHLVPFGCSLLGLMAQLMSGDSMSNRQVGLLYLQSQANTFVSCCHDRVLRNHRFLQH